MIMTTKQYDLVVVGSGPAGSTTAYFAAQAGLRVLLVDKRQELGAPIQCSGAISRHGLTSVGIEIDAEYIHQPIYGFRILNEEGLEKRIDYRQLKPTEYGEAEDQVPLGYVVDRRRFDRYLMRRAERAGVDVWLKTEGLGYESRGAAGCTVKVKRFDEEIEIQAKVLVGADGLQSQVGRWAGMQTHIRINELASCLQFIVDRVEAEPLLEIVTGHEWAPGGYAWVFPKGEGYAEIGLGVIPTMTDHDARWHVDHFMRSSFFKERFADARILEVQGGGVPLAAPLRQQYADNLILVGDAARHVNPITGGGLHTAVSAGEIAGTFLAELINNGVSPLASELKGYQDRWYEAMGRQMWRLYETKSEIFRIKDIPERNRQLYATMSEYFSPDSQYKKI
ncbi:hypothetical protein CEQ90_00795 [Lewinellaceae bacterium SD302]|nr:hypothetical protein CEQ90_00795 [Lewinellaceae bacterium SD302]